MRAAPLQPAAADSPQRVLSYVPHSGWGNQLIALTHALFFARALGRALVMPAALRHHDLSFNACNMLATKESKSLDDIVARYAEIVDDGRPPVSHFLDAAAWSVPTVPARSAEELCDTPGPGCAHTLADKCQDEAGVLSLVVPRLRADEAALVNLGSAFSLGGVHGNRSNWEDTSAACLCALKYRDELVAAVAELGAAKLGSAGAYDAIHLRLTEDFGDPALVKGRANLAAAAARVRAALASNTSRPLYVATDDVDAALRIVAAERGASKRAVVTARDFDRRAAEGVLAYLGAKAQADAEFMRALLIDAVLIVESHAFSDGGGTFSTIGVRMRECRAHPGEKVCSAADVERARRVAMGRSRS